MTPSTPSHTESTSEMKKMKAVELFKGKEGGSKMIEIPMARSPMKNQVRIKVVCAAIDTGVDAIIKNQFDGKFLHSGKAPLVLGWHFSGTIESIGEGVTEFKVGDAVWGFLRYEPFQNQGSFSEFVTVSQDECAIKPEGVPFHIAAAAATETVAALQALRDKGGLGEGKSVLIIGAGGGVGSVAVMIAKCLGAHVTAVCSRKDVDRVKAKNADVVIDRNETPSYLDESKEKYDVVFDTPCISSYAACYEALKPGGAYVTTLPRLSVITGMLRSLLSSKKAHFIACHPKKSDFELISTWLAEGKVQIDMDSRYKISDLDAAIRRQNEPDRVGRVSLDVQGGWTSSG